MVAKNSGAGSDQPPHLAPWLTAGRGPRRTCIPKVASDPAKQLVGWEWGELRELTKETIAARNRTQKPSERGSRA